MQRYDYTALHRDYIDIADIEPSQASSGPDSIASTISSASESTNEEYKSKYERLQESYKRLQRNNISLEEKLLNVSEKFSADKNLISRDLATQTQKVVEAKFTIQQLNKENYQLKSDLRIALNLLQNKPHTFVHQKLNSLPTDLQNRVRDYSRGQEREKNLRNAGQRISVPIPSNNSGQPADNDEAISAAILAKVLEQRERERSKDKKFCIDIGTQTHDWIFPDVLPVADTNKPAQGQPSPSSTPTATSAIGHQQHGDGVGATSSSSSPADGHTRPPTNLVLSDQPGQQLSDKCQGVESDESGDTHNSTKTNSNSTNTNTTHSSSKSQSCESDIDSESSEARRSVPAHVSNLLLASVIQAPPVDPRLDPPVYRSDRRGGERDAHSTDSREEQMRLDESNSNMPDSRRGRPVRLSDYCVSPPATSRGVDSLRHSSSDHRLPSQQQDDDDISSRSNMAATYHHHNPHQQRRHHAILSLSDYYPAHQHQQPSTGVTRTNDGWGGHPDRRNNSDPTTSADQCHDDLTSSRSHLHTKQHQQHAGRSHHNPHNNSGVNARHEPQGASAGSSLSSSSSSVRRSHTIDQIYSGASASSTTRSYNNHPQSTPHPLYAMSPPPPPPNPSSYRLGQRAASPTGGGSLASLAAGGGGGSCTSSSNSVNGSWRGSRSSTAAGPTTLTRSTSYSTKQTDL